MDIKLTNMPDARAVSAYLIEGPGLPAKVCVGSPDCGPEVHMNILGRTPSQGGYATARRILAGAVLVKPMAAGDHSYSGQGGGHEIKAPPHTRDGAPKVIEDALPARPCTAWLVTTEDETLVMVVPSTFSDGASIRKKGAEEAHKVIAKFVGPCTVERIDAGMRTCAPGIVGKRVSLLVARAA